MCITTTCRNNYVALVDHFLQTYTNGNKYVLYLYLDISVELFLGQKQCILKKTIEHIYTPQ
jgi:hypothetical protein